MRCRGRNHSDGARSPGRCAAGGGQWRGAHPITPPLRTSPPGPLPRLPSPRDSGWALPCPHRVNNRQRSRFKQLLLGSAAQTPARTVRFGALARRDLDRPGRFTPHQALTKHWQSRCCLLASISCLCFPLGVISLNELPHSLRNSRCLLRPVMEGAAARQLPPPCGGISRGCQASSSP